MGGGEAGSGAGAEAVADEGAGAGAVADAGAGAEAGAGPKRRAAGQRQIPEAPPSQAAEPAVVEATPSQASEPAADEAPPSQAVVAGSASASALFHEAAEYKGVQCRPGCRKPFRSQVKHGRDSLGRQKCYMTNPYSTAKEAAAAGDR